MTAYVALLRGMNLMGGTVLRMADLKALAEDLRFKSVRTYIASGNLLFESAKGEGALKAALEAALKSRMSREVAVMVRTAAEMRRSLPPTRSQRSPEIASSPSSSTSRLPPGPCRRRRMSPTSGWR